MRDKSETGMPCEWCQVIFFFSNPPGTICFLFEALLKSYHQMLFNIRLSKTLTVKIYIAF